jgi:O-antigen/teichoic acid export membrane protein
VVEALASFIVVVILARSLSIDTFGQVVFAQALAGLYFVVVDPRLEDALMRYVPIVARNSGGPGASALFRHCIVADQALGLAMTAVALGVVFVMPDHWMSAVSRPYLALALAANATAVVVGTASTAFGLTNGLATLGRLRIALAFMTVVIAMTGTVAAGAVGYLVATVVAGAVQVVVISVLGWRRMKSAFGAPQPYQRDDVRGIMRFTLKASLASTAALGSNLLPLTIVGGVAGPAPLALFRVAVAPGRLVVTGISSAASVMFPRLSQAAAELDLNRVRRVLTQWDRVAVPAAAAGAVIAWLTLPFAVRLVYGPGFAAAGEAARWMTVAALIRAAIPWTKVLLLAAGRPGLRFVILLIHCIGLGALTWWLAATSTVTAIAMGHCLAAACMFVVWQGVARWRGLLYATT